MHSFELCSSYYKLVVLYFSQFRDMSNTFIEIIESGAFEGLDNLETLDLSDNSIAVLPDGIFTPLSKLKSL